MSEALPGGYRSAPRKIGSTVHRGPTSAYAVRLLHHLSERKWPHAPRVLSHDPAGSVLSYIDGEAALTNSDRLAASQDAALAAVARLVRGFHDLTADTALAGDSEVACHNDLDPRNTIYHRLGGGLHPVALIDWDLAAPGPRVHDLARRVLDVHGPQSCEVIQRWSPEG